MSEETNRARKALKLMLALETFAAANTTNQGAARVLAQLVPLLGVDQWEKLARRAGTTRPSSRTIRLVQDLFRAKAEYLGKITEQNETPASDVDRVQSAG